MKALDKSGGDIDLPIDTPTEQLPLSFERRHAYERAISLVDEAMLREIAVAMTNIPSPTGEERQLAEYVVDRAGEIGLDAAVQGIDESSANAILRYTGQGDGPDLLLYSPIDTHTTGSVEEDLPWVGPEIRPDMKPRAHVEGPYIVGLGANNPKGHAACVLAALEAIGRAEIPLSGTLIGGFGAGGMPTNRRPVPEVSSSSVGHGSGCALMLDHAVAADFAVIAKTGWAVAWEEVGISWFTVTIHGEPDYAGVRHLGSHHNPILDLPGVIEGLEAWFAEYTARHTSGWIAPQGSIGALEAGWTYKPTFTPAACNLFLDLRVSPRTTEAQLRSEFGAAIDTIRRDNPGIELSWDMTLAIPGTSTQRDNWIVQSCMRAWEQVEGVPHAGRKNRSGATDANILRGRGLPTARIGLARVPEDAPVPDDFAKGMNVVDTPNMVKLTHALIYSVIDTCTRSRDEVGRMDRASR